MRKDKKNGLKLICEDLSKEICKNKKAKNQAFLESYLFGFLEGAIDDFDAYIYLAKKIKEK